MVRMDPWRSQGYLQTTRKTVSYEFVASHLWQAFECYDIQKLALIVGISIKHLLP
jgi:hypothetical protein